MSDEGKPPGVEGGAEEPDSTSLTRASSDPPSAEQPRQAPLPPPEGPSISPQLNIAVQATATHYRGPFPHPAIFAAMEQVRPGFTEEWLKELKAETRHRRRQETHLVEHRTKLASAGQAMGFVIAMFGLITAIMLGWMGQQYAGTAAVIAALVPLTRLFTSKRNGEAKSDKDQADKDDEQLSLPFKESGGSK